MSDMIGSLIRVLEKGTCDSVNSTFCGWSSELGEGISCEDCIVSDSKQGVEKRKELAKLIKTWRMIDE